MRQAGGKGFHTCSIQLIVAHVVTRASESPGVIACGVMSQAFCAVAFFSHFNASGRLEISRRNSTFIFIRQNLIKFSRYYSRVAWGQRRAVAMAVAVAVTVTTCSPLFQSTWERFKSTKIDERKIMQNINTQHAARQTRHAQQKEKATWVSKASLSLLLSYWKLLLPHFLLSRLAHRKFASSAPVLYSAAHHPQG